MGGSMASTAGHPAPPSVMSEPQVSFHHLQLIFLLCVLNNSFILIFYFYFWLVCLFVCFFFFCFCSRILRGSRLGWNDRILHKRVFFRYLEENEKVTMSLRQEGSHLAIIEG